IRGEADSGRTDRSLTLGSRQKSLLCGGFPQLGIRRKLWRYPLAQPLGLEHRAMRRVVEAHGKQRLGKLLFQRRVQIGPGSEHAVIVGARGPYFGERTFRHQALGAYRVPERAADRAGIGAAVEDRANDLGLASAGITVLADVAVETQRSVVLAL